MLKKLSALKKSINVERRISDYQIKDSHFLLPDEKSDPMKSAFFNREAIEEKCNRLRFKITPAWERQLYLSAIYFKGLGLNHQRIGSFNYPASLKGQSKLKLRFSEPKLTLNKRVFMSNLDYSTNYSEFTRTLEENYLEGLTRGHLTTYLPSEIRDELSMIKHLVDLENTFDKTNYAAELNDHEVLVGNLPLSFNFYAFKTKKFKPFFENGKAQCFKMIKDQLNQPALLKVKFENAEAARAFSEAVHGSEYHHSILQVLTNDQTSVENEDYANRTVYFSGFSPETTQNEIILTVNRFAKVLDIHYPVDYNFEKILYSQDVREFIEKNRNFLPPDVQIVISESDGEKNTEIVVYKGNNLEDDIKFMIDESSQNDPDSYSFEKQAALRHKENNEFIKKIIREQRTITISTFSDKCRVDIRAKMQDSEEHIPFPNVPKNLTSLSADEIRDVISSLAAHGSVYRAQLSIQRTTTECPFQATPVGNGWCLITFPTVHEARKAIYGMQFESHFNRLKIDLHAGKHLFEYFETLNAKMYLTISKNQLNRSNMIDSEQQEIHDKVIEDNVGEYYEKRLGHNRLEREDGVNLALGSKFGESDVKKVREQAAESKAQLRKKLESKIRDYMNTFVVKEKFTRSENLQGNLTGFEKVDDLMELRGRKFTVMDRETKVHLFKKRLQKTGETYELEQNKEAMKFISGLRNALGSDIDKNSSQIADILDNLALEYGYTTDEVSSFKSLLEQNQTVQRLRNSNHSTILAEETGEEVIEKPKIDTKMVSTRKEMFERLNKLNKSFSTAQSPRIPDYLEIYQRYYKILESKLNGDFFKTRQFKDFIIDNFLIKSEK